MLHGGYELFDLIRSFFSKNEKNKSVLIASPLVKIKSLDELFIFHINHSQYFQDSDHDLVLNHLKNKVNLNKLGEKLSVEQKKELGINTRLTITKSLVGVLSKKGLSLPDPKDALKRVYYRATFEHRKLEDLERMESLSIKEFKYFTCQDERDCTWCSKNHGAIYPVSGAIIDDINENCKCEWNRSILTAEITFD